MKATYEKDITENIGDDRNLILLGVRADADINYLNEVVAKQTKVITKLKQFHMEDPSTTKQSD